jgi:hypothetical protein
VAILAGHRFLDVAAFSPDGTRVLTGFGYNTARLWDAATGKVVATLAGHTAPVLAVAFSPDGTRALTGSSDHTARLWDAATGTAVATLSGHTAPITAVAFSPDGMHVLTGSWDNTARLWPAFKSTQDLIDTVRTSVPRCLTPPRREAFHLGTPPPRWCYERNLWPLRRSRPAVYRGRQPALWPASTNLGQAAARGLGSGRFVVQWSCFKIKEPIAGVSCDACTTLDLKLAT